MSSIRFILIASIALILGCKKDKAPEKLTPCTPDPCACAHEVTAEFETYEGNYTDSPQSMTLDFMHDCLVDAGTFASGVEFHAVEEDAHYTFIVGSDTINSRVGFYIIPNASPGDSLLIKLIVEKTPSPCFPNDDGRDTVSKYIYFTIDPCEPLWEDTFRGVWESEPYDTFNIALEEFEQSIGQCRGDLKATNFGKLNCTQIFYGKHKYTGRKMVFYDADNSCMLDNGWVEVPFPQKDSIFCEYYLEVSLGSYIKKRFKGKRLP